MQDGLAVSRALGDRHLRAAGLISTPELSAWQTLNTQQDSFLVLASDGATEVLSAAQICQVAAATASGMSPSPSLQRALPQLRLLQDSCGAQVSKSATEVLSCSGHIMRQCSK